MEPVVEVPVFQWWCVNSIAVIALAAALYYVGWWMVQEITNHEWR